MLLLIGRRFDPPHPGGGGAASHMSMESKTVFRPLKEARESGSRCQHIPIKVDISGGHALDGRDQGAHRFSKVTVPGIFTVQSHFKEYF